jgi:hypothetical protein
MALAAVAGVAGCGFKDYGTRTGPVPSCPDCNDATCALMASLGFGQYASTTPSRGPTCFGEWARVRHDTTDVIRLDHTVAYEGPQPSGTSVGSTATRVAITGRTFVTVGTHQRQIKASPEVRRDADTVMHRLRDIHLQR